MNISIQPLHEADLLAAGRLVTASKLALSINRLLWKNWPDEERQFRQCSGANERAFKDPACELLKAMDDQTGQILGMIILTRKPAVPAATETKPPEPIAVPEGFNPDVFTTVVTSVDKIAEATNHLEHLQITFMVVEQHHRGKGIGSQLLEEAFKRARAENIPIVTQSEPAAYDFFKNRGFQDTEDVVWDLSKWATPMSGFGLFRLAGIIWRP